MKKVTAKFIDDRWKIMEKMDSRWVKECKTDIRFAMGDQWEPEDREELNSQGRPVYTFNIIQPLLFLMSGYQRDSRSSIRAYAEGVEDELSAEIITRLIKNVMKTSRGEYKVSQAAEESWITGKSFLEPDIDYTNDLYDGEFKLHNADPTCIKIDPASTEYDLSDAQDMAKQTLLKREQVEAMFPDINIDTLQVFRPEARLSEVEEDTLSEREDYPHVHDMDGTGNLEDEYAEPQYELIEYYYRKPKTVYIAIDKQRKQVEQFDTKPEAEQYLLGLKVTSPVETESQKIRTKVKHEIWMVQKIGEKILSDDVADTYPRWKNFPFIPLFAHYTPIAKKVLKREDLAIQGIVRSLRDPQTEKNKRRSQQQHILNSVASAGWLTEEDSWVDPELVDKFGRTPGIDLQYKKGKPKPERIQPGGNLSQGHVYLEEKSEDDLRFISGVNTDLLATTESDASGRAIALRQRQGVLMLKRLFDNLLCTKELLGKFILSQLPELFSPEKAIRVLGGEFINKYFAIESGNPEQDAIDPRNEPEVLLARAAQFIDNLLQDSEIARYDIAIGEGQESPTIRYSQYSSLLEMAEKPAFQGAIPPDLLIEYSDLPEIAKKRITERIENMQAGA